MSENIRRKLYAVQFKWVKRQNPQFRGWNLRGCHGEVHLHTTKAGAQAMADGMKAGYGDDIVVRVKSYTMEG